MVEDVGVHLRVVEADELAQLLAVLQEVFEELGLGLLEIVLLLLLEKEIFPVAVLGGEVEVVYVVDVLVLELDEGLFNQI